MTARREGRIFAIFCIAMVLVAGWQLIDRVFGTDGNDEAGALFACLEEGGGPVIGTTVHDFTSGEATISGLGDGRQPWHCHATYVNGQWITEVRPDT